MKTADAIEITQNLSYYIVQCQKRYSYIIFSISVKKILQ